MKFSHLVFLALATFSLSCSSENPIETDGAMMPVVTGLRVTWDFGPKEELQWGNPLYPNVDGISIGGPTPVKPSHHYGFLFYNPYPNPARWGMNFRIAIPERTHFKLWLAPAYFQGADATSQMLMSTVNIPLSGTEYPIVDQELEAGDYEFGFDRTRTHIPAGLYRAFVQFKNKLEWRDIWLYDDLGELPDPLYGHAMLGD